PSCTTSCRLCKRRSMNQHVCLCTESGSSQSARNQPRNQDANPGSGGSESRNHGQNGGAGGQNGVGSATSSNTPQTSAQSSGTQQYNQNHMRSTVARVEPEIEEAVACNARGEHLVYLPTLRLDAVNIKTKVTMSVRTMLDTGSTSSFIS